MRHALAACLFVLQGAACGGGGPAVTLNVEQGSLLGGPQETTFQIRGALVTRAELYVDAERAAESEVAPFVLSWDTRDFAEGHHELTLRAYTNDSEDARPRLAEMRGDPGGAPSYFPRDEDGRQFSHTSKVNAQFDNSPPYVAPSAEAYRHGSLLIPVSDNFALAEVTVTSGDDSRTFQQAPYSLPWSGVCGFHTVQVRAVDIAGWLTAATLHVFSGERDDFDCDGFETTHDCDDHDPARYPSAIELDDSVDDDCDGKPTPDVPEDLDGDGVASRRTGGDDCDDNDAAVHGLHVEYGREDIHFEGPVFMWDPGDAAIASTAPGTWTLFFKTTKGIYRVTRVNGATSTAQSITTSWGNPGSVATTHAGDFVAFGRGNDLVILTLDGNGDWVEAATVTAPAHVSRVALARESPSSLNVAFQAGHEVYAVSSVDGTWGTPQLLVDAEATLAQAPAISAGGHVTFRTPSASWYAHHAGSSTYQTAPLATPLSEGSWMTIADGLAVFAQEGRGLVYAPGGDTPLVTFLRPATWLSRLQAPDTWIANLDGYGSYALRQVGDKWRAIGALGDLERIDTASPRALAGRGVVIYQTSATVDPAEDPAGDGKDQNCDGQDGT